MLGHLPHCIKRGLSSRPLDNGDHNRIYGLDILRALAILTVIYDHGSFLLGTRVNIRYYTSICLGDGVTMFFVLSGFLIGNILLAKSMETESTMRKLLHFWLRRWFRTLPAYYLVLCVISIICLFEQSPLPSNYWYYWIFSQNILTPHPLFFPEAWSLTVEEWFYFLVPLIVFLCIARQRFTSRRRAFLVFLLVGIVGITAYRIEFAATHDITNIATWDSFLRKIVFTRLDSIGFGLMGAYLVSYHQRSWNAYKSQLLWLGVMVCLFNHFEADWLENMLYKKYFEFSVAPIGVLLLLPFLNSIKIGSGCIYRFITLISKISYSMYLLHYTLIQAIIVPAIFGHGYYYGMAYCEYALYLALTIGLSYLMFTFFEVPVMNVRDRFHF